MLDASVPGGFLLFREITGGQLPHGPVIGNTFAAFPLP